jgi:hypothetical protein
MGSKIILIGRLVGRITRTSRVIAFKMIESPAQASVPKELPKPCPSVYVVYCTRKQWKKTEYRSGDELVIEGNPAARVTGDGEVYIEVATLKITTKRKEAGLKLRQLNAHRDECLAALEEAQQTGNGVEEAEAALAKAEERLDRFRQAHPELK